MTGKESEANSNPPLRRLCSSPAGDGAAINSQHPRRRLSTEHEGSWGECTAETRRRSATTRSGGERSPAVAASFSIYIARGNPRWRPPWDCPRIAFSNPPATQGDRGEAVLQFDGSRRFRWSRV